MYLRDEVVNVKVGTRLVPFCKDCNSQEIETIQTCKKCGSHNITANWNDERSQRIEYKQEVRKIYKCDKCGKEFDGMKIDNFISYDCGEFCNYHISEDELEYDTDNKVYCLQKDLCAECKQHICDSLNIQLRQLTHSDNILSTLNNFIEGE